MSPLLTPVTGMQWCKLGALAGGSVQVRAGLLAPTGGAVECHLALWPCRELTPEDSGAYIARAFHQALHELGLPPESTVWQRWFSADAQTDVARVAALNLAASPCAISVAGQPPTPPATLALWSYHLHDPASRLQKTGNTDECLLQRGTVRHLWSAGLAGGAGGSSATQTRAVLERYLARLARHDFNLAAHTLRTWFVVEDIDHQYGGLVRARRELFSQHGLTADTHFITSTGIGGHQALAGGLVTLDAYAAGGLQPEQVHYLNAPDNLCPAARYGVTFERGTAIVYGDRIQVMLAGTASINAEGEVCREGDLEGQVHRTLDNMEALLYAGGAQPADVNLLLAYVRNGADRERAGSMVEERWGGLPLLVVEAPVCRPGWLFEAECMAVVAEETPHLLPF